MVDVAPGFVSRRSICIFRADLSPSFPVILPSYLSSWHLKYIRAKFISPRACTHACSRGSPALASGIRDDSGTEIYPIDEQKTRTAKSISPLFLRRSLERVSAFGEGFRDHRQPRSVPVEVATKFEEQFNYSKHCRCMEKYCIITVRLFSKRWDEIL